MYIFGTVKGRKGLKATSKIMKWVLFGCAMFVGMGGVYSIFVVKAFALFGGHFGRR